MMTLGVLMRRFSFSSLRGRLLLLVLLAIIPALGLILYTAWEQRHRAAIDAENNALRLARLVSANQDDLIEGARQLLIGLAQFPEVRGDNSTMCNAVFSKLLKQYRSYLNFGVTKSDGDVWCSALPITGRINVADRPYIRRALDTRDFAVGEYQIGRVTGKASINFAYPILDEKGQAQTVVIAALDLAWLNQHAAKTHLPTSATLTVIDRKGTILVRYPDPEKWLGQSLSETSVVKTILTQREGVVAASGLDGIPRLYGFTPLGSESRDAYVSIGIPEDVAFAAANRILARNLAGLGTVGALALVAAWFGVDLLILRRVNDLVVATKRIGAGDLSSRTRLPYDEGELGQLSRAFDQMAEKIQRQLERITALREISLATASTLDLRAVLNTLLQKIDLFLPYPAAAVRLLNKESGVLEDVAFRNLDENEWKAHVQKVKDAGMLGKWIIKNKSPLMVCNVLSDPRTRDPDFFRKNGLISYLGVPLIVKDEVLGVLSFYTKEEHQFSDEEVEFLSTLAGQAAIAIHNSQLYEQVTQRTNALSALYAVTATANQTLDLDTVVQAVLKQIAEILHFDTTRIFLINPGTDELHLKASYEAKPGVVFTGRVIRRGVGITGKVAESGEPMIFENVHDDPQYRELSQSKAVQKSDFSFFSVFPIKAKLRTLGIIVCIGQTPRRLKTDEIRLIVSMTDQIGVAIENASLFERTKTQAVELERANADLKRREEVQRLLKELSQDIATLDIDSLLGKLTEKVREILKVDICDVRVANKGIWRVMGVSGIEPERLQDPMGTARGRSAWILKNRRPLVVPDMSKRPDLQTGRILNRLGIKGYLGVPLFSREGEIIGVLRALTYQPREFNKEELDLVQQMANDAAIAVENARLLERIKSQAMELEKSNKVKEEFLGVMSHELRTPINVIIGYTEVIKERTLGEVTQEQEKALEKVISNSKELLRMISGILHATSIQAKAAKVERDEVNLGIFLGELRSACEVSLNKELTLNWDYPPDLPVMKTDSDKLQHILRNLINNAIKFTEKGSVKILVRCLLDSKMVEFRVADTGIGIPKEFLSIIFEKFRQVDSSNTRAHEGVGLGLHIVKTFAELLGGKIEVESEPGKGSTFTVTLPYAV